MLPEKLIHDDTGSAREAFIDTAVQLVAGGVKLSDEITSDLVELHSVLIEQINRDTPPWTEYKCKLEGMVGKLSALGAQAEISFGATVN